jgi:hypothetical protein
MDTKSLIADAKARFNHNSAKAQLKDKYDSKLIVADQNGLWRADLETINFLNATTDEQVVIIDTFDNPVKVERALLMEKLLATYKQVMADWHNEWSELEKKR